MESKMNHVKFPQFAIEKELGRGGMGVVYLAVDKKLKRRVAVKVLLPHANSKSLQRFIQEARVIARLNHENIIKIYDVGEQPQLYFTMEYISGTTLDRYLCENEMSIGEIVELFSKMAKALHVAHKNGIIHRDLKPSNIMIKEDKSPVIMDFGLAKTDESNLSQTHDILGTPAYMPPEQFRGQKADRRSDVYSLGACLYECLTMKKAFAGESSVNIMYKVLNEDPISPRSISSQIPLDLEAICLKCLEKERSQRYSSMRLLATDLKNFSQNKRTIARPLTWQGDLVKFIQRHRKFSIGMFVSVLATTLFIIFHIQSLRFEKNRAQSAEIEAKQAEKSVKKEQERSENTLYVQNIRLLDQAYQNNNSEICYKLLADISKQVHLRKYHTLETTLYKNLLSEHIVYKANHSSGITDCDVLQNTVAISSHSEEVLLLKWNGERLVPYKTLAVSGSKVIQKIAFFGRKHIAVVKKYPFEVEVFDIQSLQTTGKKIRLYGSGDLLICQDLKASQNLLAVADLKVMQTWSTDYKIHKYNYYLGMPVSKEMGISGFDIYKKKIAIIGSKPEIEYIQFKNNFSKPQTIPQESIDSSCCAWLNESEVVCGYKDGSIFIWNVDTRKKTCVFEDRSLLFYQLFNKAHSRMVDIIKISPQGFVVSSAGNVIKVWKKNPKSQKYEIMHVLKGHQNDIVEISFLANNIISCSTGDHTTQNVIVWNLQKIVKQSIAKTTRNITGIKFTNSKRLHVFAGLAHQIYDLQNPQSKPKSNARMNLLTQALSQDTKLIACGFIKIVTLHDSTTGKQVHELIDEEISPLTHKDKVTAIHFGKQHFFSAGNGRIKCWDTNSGRLLKTFDTQSTEKMESIGTFIDNKSTNKIFAVIGNKIHIFDEDNATAERQIELQHAPSTCKVTPDNKIFITNNYKYLHAYSIATGKLLAKLNAHTHKVQNFMITRDSRRLVSCGEDQNLCIWDMEDLSSMDNGTIFPLVKIRHQSKLFDLDLQYGENGKVSSIVVAQENEVVKWNIH